MQTETSELEDFEPSGDIQNSESLEKTMINGRLYNCDTMNEIGSDAAECGQFYFEMEGGNNTYPFYIQTESCMKPSCLCGQ